MKPHTILNSDINTRHTNHHISVKRNLFKCNWQYLKLKEAFKYSKYEIKRQIVRTVQFCFRLNLMRNQLKNFPIVLETLLTSQLAVDLLTHASRFCSPGTL